MGNNWPKVKLGEVVTPAKRAEAPVPGESYRQIGVRLWGEGAYEREVLDGAQTRYTQLFRAEAGDIIVNKIWARNGSVAVVPPQLSGCYVSGEFPIFTSNPERLDSQWMHWLTKTPDFWSQCDDKSRGTSGKNRIRPEQFLNVEIPLPSISAQQQIVARIEDLTNKIEQAATLRRQSDDEIQAFVDAAASKLFYQFTETKQIEEIAEVRGGIQKGPHRTPGENPVRYLTVAHVQRNKILTDDPRFFEVTPEELERWRLMSGDVLIIEGNGSADQIGRTALFRGEIDDCVHQNHVIRIRPNQKWVLPEFLNSFLNSSAGQDAVQSQSRTTSGLRTLSVGRIKAISVPIPPLEQQQRTVNQLADLDKRAGMLKKVLSGTSQELAALMPSILDKAFRGEL